MPIAIPSGKALMAVRLHRYSALLLPLIAWAQPAPLGTEVSVRLITGLSTHSTKSGDRVDAVVIAPVIVEGKPVIVPGAILQGTVEKVGQPSAKSRALLKFRFREIAVGNSRRPIDARIAAVDNARE